MKANEVQTKNISIEEIYSRITNAANNSEFKVFYPDFVKITDETKLQLMRDGFKVYEGRRLYQDEGLTIEW